GRFTLVATVFIMALMVVPLSVVNPRQGRVLSMPRAELHWALHAGGDRLHYGADGGAAQRGEPASGPRAVDA
ncbi:hypothetical protein C7D71_31155, partial [Klebsiella pneumoniae]